MTKSGKSVKISEEEKIAVFRIISRDFYLYADKTVVTICPYQFDFIYKVKINGFEDYEIVEKIKPKRQE